MQQIREAWKAVLAFFAPGLVLIGEKILLDDGLTTETLWRSLVAGVVTSALVYLKSNGASPALDTSTPQR